MSDKKNPQPFNSNLFSSPGGSGGLSLGFDQSFSSPFSLAPALSTSTNSNQSDDGGKKQVSIGSPFSQSRGSSSLAGQSTSPHTDSPRRSSSPVGPTTVSSSGGISLTGLSTVPLDTPPAALVPENTATVHRSDPSEALLHPEPSTSSPPTTTILYNDEGIDYRGGGRDKFGWNDPPSMNQTPSRPVPSKSITAPGLLASDSTVADNYSIQPHLEPHSLNPNSSGPSQPLPGQGPPPSQSATVSNPYRIGVGLGSKKPAYGVSGIASFGPSGAVPSQPLMAPSQPPAPANVQTFPQAPPPSQEVLLSSSSTFPPPVTASTPSQSGTGVSSVWGGAAQTLQYHWFYLRSGEKYWIPFSLLDSSRLEESMAVSGQDPSQEVLVPTDGGRYDVNLHCRLRQSVYWEEPASQVRRCSWFYKGEGDRWYLPYDEQTAAALEEEFMSALSQGQWNRRVEIAGGQSVIMHSQSAIVHYPSQQGGSGGSVVSDDYSNPRAVLRGFAELNKVDGGEQTRIDHLVFVVHGIGAHCDLSFRSLVDCVDDFREVSQLMLKTHMFSQAVPRGGDNGGRVEYLPVHWHAALHKDESGVDNRLKPLTLPSISRLRDFTNSTLTDILFFTSPVYCQTIISQAASEMNRMFELFKSRNPQFQGGVSVVGHSLGSCVLFDLLDHQQLNGETPKPNEPTTQPQDDMLATSSDPEPPLSGGDESDSATPTLEEALSQLGLSSLCEIFNKEQVDYDALLMCTNEDLKELGVSMGPRKKLSSFITQQAELKRQTEERREKELKEKQAREKEQQKQLEAMNAARQRATLQGVKIVRGLAGTGQPYIDYPQLSFSPRHLFAIGSPIGLFLSVRGVDELGPNFCLPTCPRVYNIFHPFDPVAYRLEPLVTDSAPPKPVLMPHHKGRKRFHLELYENIENVSTNLKTYLVDGMRNMWQQLNEFARSHTSSGQEQLQVAHPELPQEKEPEPEPKEEKVQIGRLNQGERVDFVLQEKTIEKLNEYLFALSSHLCYWRSEDTALFILKEVYNEPNPELIKS